MATANNLPTGLQGLDPGLRLADASAIASALSAGSGRSTANALTATAPQTQAGALALTQAISRITGGNANDGVKLPQSLGGQLIVVINDSGQTLNLWPFLGDKINDAATNASVSIANNTISIYVSPARGLWFGGAVTLET